MKQKKERLINHGLTRLVLFALVMLLPLGAWAETIDGAGIWLGETLVKEANAADVFGDGTVHYDYSTNTLTLNNASVGAIGVRYFTTNTTPLNIELVGNNTITSTEGKAAIYSKSNESGVRVNIQSTALHKGTLTMNVENNEQFYFIHNAINYTIADPMAVVTGDIDTADGTVVIGETYGLTVAGTEVNITNADNITSDYITSGTVSYDAATNTLTLEDATIIGNEISGGSIITKSAELNIVVVGTNTLNCGGDSCTAIRADAPISQKLSIVNGDINCTLEFSGSRAIRNFSSLTIRGLGWNGDHTYHDNKLYSYDDQEVGSAILSFADASYGLTVGGVEVTSANASNITGGSISDGSLSYNAGSNTLTLNGAVITAEGIVWNEEADLTINVIGTANSITVESGAAVKSNYEGYNLHFSKGSEESTLILQSESANAVFSGFNNAAATLFGDFYRLQSRDGFKAGITTQVYPLKVNGYQVNYLSDDFRGYKDRIFPLNSPGDTTVKFVKSGTINLLTLEGADFSVNGGADAGVTVIESGFNNLKVHLTGANEILCNGPADKVFAASTDFARVVFELDEEAGGSLTVSVAEKANIFSGITPVYEAGTDLIPQGNNIYKIGATTNYGLYIGSVHVTNANAAAIQEYDPENIIVADGGSVTFDAENSVLSLTNATLKTPITTSLDNLTVKFAGTNKVNEDRPYDYYHGISTDNSTATLTFEKVGEGTLELYASTNKSVVCGFASVSFSSGDGKCYMHSAPTAYSTENGYTNIYSGGMIDFATISGEEAYPLWLLKDYQTCSQVTKSGEAIAAAAITSGTVTFNAETATLNMSSAKIAGAILSGLDNLTLGLDGTNEVVCEEDDISPISSGNKGTLTLSKSGTSASLQLTSAGFYTSPAVQGFETFNYTGFNIDAGITPSYGLYERWGSDLYGLYDAGLNDPDEDKSIISAFFATGEILPLWVGGVRVTTDNAADIKGSTISGGAISGVNASFDTKTNTLTLDRAIIDMEDVETFPIKSGLYNLTVKLLDDNSITLHPDYPYFVQYVGDGGLASSPKLTLDTEGYMDDGLYWLGSLTLLGVNSTDRVANGYAVTNSIDLVPSDIDPNDANYIESGWKYREAHDDDEITIFKFESFDLWLGEGRVISTDLSAGKGSSPRYNPVTKTLSFSENELNYPIKSSLPELVVEVESQNFINYNSDTSPAFFFQEKGSVTEGTLQFVLAEWADPANENYFSIFNASGAAIKGFSSVTVESPLALTTPETIPATWDENTHSFVVSDLAHLGIMVMKDGDSYSITNKNRTNVLGEAAVEPSVQFDGEHTLVLNNASLNSINVSTNPSFTTTGLTIWLKGENVIDNSADPGGQPSAITFTGEKNIGLTFDTNEVEGGTLVCSYDDQTASLFPGFDDDYHKNLMATVNTTAQTVSIAMLMNPIVTDENQEETREGDGQGLGKDIEGLAAEIIADYQVNNILYTLPGANDGCLEVDGKKVVALNTKMTDEVVNEIAQKIKDGTYLPGTPAFSAVFNGMTFLLPPGSGTMTFTVRTNGAGTLNVKVGTDEPTVITSPEGFAEFDVDYAVTDETYVLIYNTADEVGAEGRPFAPGRKITNTTEMEKAVVRPRTIRSSAAPPMEPKVLEKDDVATWMADGHLIIDDADLAGIADDAFEGLPDLTFVDLSQTGITGLFIDRTKAPFSALPENTFIYMPVGNDPAEGEKNVVIGTVCPDMELADGDAPFEVSYDFTAAQVTQARNYSSLLDKNCSIYLPFALDAETAASLGAFYELKSIDEGKVTMETVDATTANTPYMFKPAKETVSAKMVEVKTLTSAPSTGDARFIGTYEQKYICSTATEQYYCFVGGDDESTGKFVHVIDTPMEVNPFRAYIKIDGDALGRELLLDFGQSTTGIDTVTRQTLTGKMYNLQGREVRNVRGIVIVNGKKVMVK